MTAMYARPYDTDNLCLYTGKCNEQWRVLKLYKQHQRKDMILKNSFDFWLYCKYRQIALDNMIEGNFIEFCFLRLPADAYRCLWDAS